MDPLRFIPEKDIKLNRLQLYLLRSKKVCGLIFKIFGYLRSFDVFAG